MAADGEVGGVAAGVGDGNVFRAQQSKLPRLEWDTLSSRGGTDMAAATVGRGQRYGWGRGHHRGWR